MTHTILTNWEILLDAVGICCCALSILYLIRLKRKFVLNGWVSNPKQLGTVGTFQAMPMGFPEDMSFDRVLASAKKDFRMDAAEGTLNRTAADPYAEVRRLLDLGMEPHRIAERINIPRCELDLIVSLHQIQPEMVSV